MKIRSSLIVTLIVTQLLSFAATQAHDTRTFEIRTYYAAEGKLDNLLARFRDHTCALFEKHGIENIGYWIPKDNADNKLVYIIAFPDRVEQKTMWRAFLDDPEWKAAAKASTVNGRLVSKIDSLFLDATDYSPRVVTKQNSPNQLFELRTYKAAEGRLPNLHARFEDHTIGLFDKHGIENIIYMQPQADQEGGADTLIYLISHKDEAARKASFGAFGQDPDWKSARKASEERAGGGLTVKGGVTYEFLEPTDFSPMK